MITMLPLLYLKQEKRVISKIIDAVNALLCPWLWDLSVLTEYCHYSTSFQNPDALFAHLVTQSRYHPNQLSSWLQDM